MQILKRIGVSAMAMLVALSVFVIPSFAQGTGTAAQKSTYVAAPSGSRELRLEGVHNKSVYSYSAVSVYYRGTRLAVSGRIMGDALTQGQKATRKLVWRRYESTNERRVVADVFPLPYIALLCDGVGYSATHSLWVVDECAHSVTTSPSSSTNMATLL